MKTRAQRRRLSATPHGTEATPPHGTEARPRARARYGLEALPLPAREIVVLLLRPARRKAALDVLQALPFVSQGTLAALRELQMPIGEFWARSVEEAVQQAHAPRRAFDLGILDLSHCHELTDLSGLTSCATLRTLILHHCYGLTDLSALAGFAALDLLDLRHTNVTNVSWARRLRDASLARPLVLQAIDGRVGAGRLRDAAHAQPLKLPPVERSFRAGGLRSAAHA